MENMKDVVLLFICLFLGFFSVWEFFMVLSKQRELNKLKDFISTPKKDEDDTVIYRVKNLDNYINSVVNKEDIQELWIEGECYKTNKVFRKKIFLDVHAHNVIQTMSDMIRNQRSIIVGKMSELAADLEEMAEPACPEECECFEFVEEPKKAKKGGKK